MDEEKKEGTEGTPEVPAEPKEEAAGTTPEKTE